MKNKKGKTNGKLIIVMILIFGWLLYNNNVARSVNGWDSWYADPMLITQGALYYVVFFGLISGYVIAKVLGRRV